MLTDLIQFNQQRKSRNVALSIFYFQFWFRLKLQLIC